MRNLFLFLIRFNHIFVFLILETVSIVFVIRNHSYHRTGFLNSSGVITGSIYNMYFKMGEFLNLGTVNERLMEENAALRSRTGLADNPIPEFCIDSQSQYQFIPVKVINFTTSRSSNYITVNKGSAAGIKEDMGLITGNGIVGIINQVSENFATAMSVLHKDSRVSVKVARFNYPGTLQWNGGDPLEGEISGIPQHLPIANGDTIITSGFSAIFPENIPVGIITGVAPEKGSSFYNVRIRFSADLNKLQFAYVVHNIYQDEQHELEMKNE